MLNSGVPTKLPDREHLWRRFPPTQWNPVLNELVPLAFTDKSLQLVDRSISVNRAKYSTIDQFLSNVPWKGKFIVASHWGVAKINAKNARKITKIPPQASPIPADLANNVPENPAHALIFIDKSISEEEAFSIVVRLTKKFKLKKPPQ